MQKGATMRRIALLLALFCLAPVVAFGQIAEPQKPNHLMVGWGLTDGFSTEYGRTFLLGSTSITPLVVSPIGNTVDMQPRLGLAIARPLGKDFLLSGWMKSDRQGDNWYRAEASWQGLIGIAVERKGIHQESIVRVAFVEFVVDDKWYDH